MRDIKNRNNNSSGFTFVEILLSLTILASSMYIFGGIQFRAVNRVRKSSDEIERIFFVKKELYKLFYKNTKKNRTSQKSTLNQPETTITIGRKKIDQKKSSLKEFSKEIDIVIATGSWKTGPSDRLITMISFLEKPKPKVKQNSEKKS